MEERRIVLLAHRSGNRTKLKTALRSICTALAAFSLLFMLGVAGGIEHDTVALSVGCPMMLASLGLGTLFAKLATRLR